MTHSCFAARPAARSCLTDASPAVVDEAAAHIEALLASGAHASRLCAACLRSRAFSYVLLPDIAGRLTPAAVTGELLAALSVAPPACVSPLAAAVADVALQRGGGGGGGDAGGGAHPLALALRAAPGAQAALLLAVTRALAGPDGCAPPASNGRYHPRLTTRRVPVTAWRSCAAWRPSCATRWQTTPRRRRATASAARSAALCRPSHRRQTPLRRCARRCSRCSPRRCRARRAAAGSSRTRAPQQQQQTLRRCWRRQPLREIPTCVPSPRASQQQQRCCATRRRQMARRWHRRALRCAAPPPQQAPRHMPAAATQLLRCFARSVPRWHRCWRMPPARAIARRCWRCTPAPARAAQVAEQPLAKRVPALLWRSCRPGTRCRC